MFRALLEIIPFEHVRIGRLASILHDLWRFTFAIKPMEFKQNAPLRRFLATQNVNITQV